MHRRILYDGRACRYAAGWGCAVCDIDPNCMPTTQATELKFSGKILKLSGQYVDVQFNTSLRKDGEDERSSYYVEWCVWNDEGKF